MNKRVKMSILLSFIVLPLLAMPVQARKTTERDLKKQVESINKNLDRTPNPKSGMRMDFVSAGPGLLMTYNITMIQHSASDLKLNEFNSWMKKQLVGKLCTNQDMKNVIQDNVTVRYIYKGYDGSSIATINITRKDCNF